MFSPGAGIQGPQRGNVYFVLPFREVSLTGARLTHQAIRGSLGANVVKAQMFQNRNGQHHLAHADALEHAGTVVEVASSPSQPLPGWPREDQSRPRKAWVRSWPCHWRLWMRQPPCLESQFPQSEFWNDRNAFPVSLKEFLRKPNEVNYERIFKIKQLRAGLSPEGKRGAPKEAGLY